jgi:hypothetical protein
MTGTHAGFVTDEQVSDYVADVFGAELRSERFRSLSPERQAEAMERARGRGREFLQRQAERIVSRDITLRDGSVHPDNKHTRRLFERLTLLSLPKTYAGSLAVLVGYLGAERVANIDRAEDERRKAEANAERAKADAERYGPHAGTGSFMVGSKLRARAYSHLDGLVRWEGVVMKWHEFVERKVSAGCRPRVWTGTVYGKKRAGECKARDVTEYQLVKEDGSACILPSKTAHDYAAHLIAGGQSRTADKKGGE